jgi:hypothetical protein
MSYFQSFLTEKFLEMPRSQMLLVLLEYIIQTESCNLVVLNRSVGKYGD